MHRDIDIYSSFRQSKFLVQSQMTDGKDLYAKISKATGQNLHVVVIGESSNRDHWSLYGYERETTPYAKKWFSECNYCSYSNNAWAADKYTLFALDYALTNKSQYHSQTQNGIVSIIDVLNKAGFHTVWISNQQYVGAENNGYNQIGQRAKEALFVEKKQFSFADDRPIETVLLKPLEDVISKNQLKKNVIVFIHLMGSHAPYRYRYTDDFNFWEGGLNPNSLNAYDNSILFTDMIINKIKEICKNADSFLYFSDHGELPGTGRDHLHIDMFKVPILAEFKKPTERQMRFLKNMKNNVPFTTDGIFDTLVGIYGVETNYYQRSLDLSDEQYSFKRVEDLLVNSGRNKIIDGFIIEIKNDSK